MQQKDTVTDISFCTAFQMALEHALAQKTKAKYPMDSTSY